MKVKYSIECNNGQLILRFPLAFFDLLYHLYDDTESKRFFDNLNDALLSVISDLVAAIEVECDLN